MRSTTVLLATLLLASLSGCATGERVLRATPFHDDGDLPDPGRINAWPLYYQTDDLAVVLWPVFDVDADGFALRPLLARDGSSWSVLYPLSGWDTANDSWWLLPAYSLPNNRGVALLFNIGDFNHVGPAWWLVHDDGRVTDWGLFPLFGTGELRHVGPVWWLRGEGDASAPFGLFPLAYFDARSGYVLTSWWHRDEQGELDTLGVLPLFYWKDDAGYERLITPLGGRSWGGDGERGFVNVLGPVFHRSTNGERTYVALAWPLFALEREGERTDVRVFPLFRHRSDGDAYSTSALAGLIERARDGSSHSFRLAPLVSHNVGMPGSFLDALTLYGYRESAASAEAATSAPPPPDVSMHIGTPLLFRYERRGSRSEWNSLLGILEREVEGDASSFSFLYYLYRQQRQGEQVRRDFFPFFTWDSGPERSEFSFLWRVFRRETEGGKTRGHILFIPFGEHG